MTLKAVHVYSGLVSTDIAGFFLQAKEKNSLLLALKCIYAAPFQQKLV